MAEVVQAGRLGRLLEGVSRDDIAESIAYREPEALEPAGLGLEATALARPWQEVISQRAYDFIVTWETGGPAYYRDVLEGRPVWPGWASGVTIGCGYDLGYHEPHAFAADWGGRIPRAAAERLERCIGFRTVEPGRGAKVARAKALCRSLADIEIPWEVAIRQFDEGKMPILVATLYRTLDNLDRLHPHCRGALLSLVFNRGSGGFGRRGDRYRELREIGDCLRDGSTGAIARIPEAFRSMQRIWGRDSSLAKRRRGEAVLFEEGLEEERLVGAATVAATMGAAAAERGPAERDGRPAEEHDDVPEPTDVTPDPDEDVLAGSGLEGAEAAVAQVAWNGNDDDQPDYRHLPKPGGSAVFELRAEDLELLIRCNAFAVLPGRVVFALRGARVLGADKAEDAEGVILEDIRPDHRDYRCVIGVLDRERRLWAYKASTVPNAEGVVLCRSRAPSGPFAGNVLPTGCYTYTVGTHKPGKRGEVRGVLRLGRTPTGASQAVVLRSLNDLCYDRRDFWDKTAPADNIHPGWLARGFSSLGCLTLPGRYNRDTRRHSGLWADFRGALGMGPRFEASDDGRQFSCVLLTGLDARLAAGLRTHGGADDPDSLREALVRLRHGSQGAGAARLQEALGLAPDPEQLVGPVTRAALVCRQQEALGWADAIYGPETEAALGLDILAQ